MDVRFVTKEERLARQKKDLADKARRALDDDPLSYIKQHTIKGHAFESHVATNETLLLDNVISGRKLGDTKFASEELQNHCIHEVLYNQMENLQEWVRKAKPGDKVLYAADFTDENGDPEIIGTGFLSDASSKYRNCSGSAGVSFIESNLAGVVIKRNPDAPDGWEITTAFPMSYPTPELCTEDTVIRMPKRDFSSTLHKTATYKAAPNLQKLYLDAKASKNGPRPRYELINIAPDKLWHRVQIYDRKQPYAPRVEINQNLDVNIRTQGHGQRPSDCSKKLLNYAQALTASYQSAPATQTGPDINPAPRPSINSGRSLAGLEVQSTNGDQASIEY